MIETLSHIYAKLQDEQSKIIYKNRLLNAVTKDDRYLGQMCAELYCSYKNEYASFGESIAFVRRNPEHKVAIFGAGQNGLILMEFLKCNNIFIDYFIDNNKNKHNWQGVVVLTPTELLEKQNTSEKVVILSCVEKDDCDAIKEQLVNMGIDVASYMRVFPILNTQYFDKNIVIPDENEVFIDAGSLDLKDSYRFIDWCSGIYKKIYAFEPDADNFKKCMENKGGNKKIDLLQAGLWSSSSEKCFSGTGWGDAALCESGDTAIQTLTIDDIVTEKATFIKMDIEGAELEALRGAASTIRRDKPKLAICIYHKSEDILEIPEYLMKLVPEYKFYIRHYTMYRCETVLYAIC